jgi:hypothetical protein
MWHMGVRVNARRRGWAILMCAGLLILIGVSAATLDKDAVNTAAQWANILALPVGAYGAFQVWWDRRNARQTGPLAADRLGQAAASLRSSILRQWSDEVGARRLRHPRPLRLRWEVFDYSTARLPPVSTVGSLVDFDDQRPPAQELVDAFARLPTRQLLILGEPGAGKTTLAILFVLAAAVPDDRSRPVPVLLTLASWRPDQEALRAWIARRVGEDYPELRNSERFGPGILGELWSAGRILPVLDGLDEMPSALMDAALRQIGDETGVGGAQMVITSRRVEYEQAVAVHGTLPVAAVVTIRPVDVEDSLEFLTAEDDPDRWAGVAAEMRSEPTGPLATALSTPLMIALARAVYRAPGNAPDELRRSSSSGVVVSRLLDRFLPTVYRSPGQLRRSRRWLGSLAFHLQHRLRSPDLAWWQIPEAVPRAVPGVLVAIVLIAAGTVGGVVSAPIEGPPGENALFGMLVGLAVGMVAGINITRRHAAPATPSSRWAPALTVGVAVLRDAAAVTVAAIALTMVALGTSWISWDGVLLVIRVGMLAGLVGIALALIANGLRVGRGTAPSRPSLRLRSLVRRLAGGLGAGLLIGIPVGAITGILVGIDDWKLNSGLNAGGLSTLMVAGAIGVPVGVGRWFSAPVELQDELSPQATLRGDRTALLVVALASAVSAGFAFFFLFQILVFAGDVVSFIPNYEDSEYRPVLAGIWGGCVVFGVVLFGSGSLWMAYSVSRLWLAARGRLPGRLMAFLADAHRRGILRQAGASYQFRHALVQIHLAGPAGAAPGRAVLRPRSTVRSRIRRASASTASALVLVALVVVVGVPPIRDGWNGRIAEQHAAEARLLGFDADKAAVTDRNAALRLQIAATEMDEINDRRGELETASQMWLGGVREWFHYDSAELTNRTAAFGQGDDVRIVDLGPDNLPDRLIRSVKDFKLSRDGTRMVFLDSDDNAWSMDLKTPDSDRIGMGKFSSVTAISDNGRTALLADPSDRLFAVDLAAAGSTRVDFGSVNEITDAEITPDGTRIVVGRADGVVTWNVAEARPRSIAIDRLEYVDTVSENGRIVVVEAQDRKYAYDLVNAGRIADLGSEARAVAVTPRGTQAVLAGPDKSVWVRSLAGSSDVPIWLGSYDGGDMQLTRDGNWAVFVDAAGGLEAADLRGGRRVLPIGEASSFAVDASDNVVYNDVDDKVKIWSLIRSRAMNWPPNIDLEVSTDGGSSTIADDSGRISLVDLSGKRFVSTDLGAPAAFDDIEVSTGSRRAISLSSSSSARAVSETSLGVAMMWNVGQPLGPLPAEAISQPRDWACARIGNGISRAEWQRIAPDVEYRQICQKPPPRPRK